MRRAHSQVLCKLSWRSEVGVTRWGCAVAPGDRERETTRTEVVCGVERERASLVLELAYSMRK